MSHCLQPAQDLREPHAVIAPNTRGLATVRALVARAGMDPLRLGTTFAPAYLVILFTKIQEQKRKAKWHAFMANNDVAGKGYDAKFDRSLRDAAS